jgi:glycosyltransferase involved in cell wall biosynthesis
MIYVKDFLSDQKILATSRAYPPPSVSVIMPTYQRLRDGLLERSIKSVIAQEYDDFELLVMDDGSSDGSSDLIERYRAQDPRIIHVRHEQNCGLPGLRVNEGIELARGKYLAFQFDDDVWRKNTLIDLVAEATRQTEPAVIIGKSLFTTRMGKHVYPFVDINMVSLTEDNRFANNSVIFPRSLIDTYGMYDPHIGMRRLCDWDLWLRYIPHVPFIMIDQIVSDVFESNEGAIGVTVPWDLPLFRFLHSISRNHLLTPDVWRDYPVDALHIGGVEVSGDIRRRLYEEQIVPYYFKHRHSIPDLGGFSATLDPLPQKTISYVKQSYDVSNDVTIGQYNELTQQRNSFNCFYQPLDQVSTHWHMDTDMLLLMRTVEDRAVELAQQALERDRALGLYLDDDLLHFHEYGPQFDYLAPGTPYYNNIRKIIQLADAILVTTDYIGNSVKADNPRIVPHNNTISAGALPKDIHPLNPQQIRIAYVGSGYRLEEFRQIWDALLNISRRYTDRISFEFWGLDIKSLPPLASPVVQQPFTFSYPHYLDRLRNANFDILLIPMLDHPKPRLGKSLIKYYETAVAGALGIFSDVPQYASLPAGLTCLKAENTIDSWYDTLHEAVEMEAAKINLLRRRCLEHVREEFTAEAQIDSHEAALRALEFHHKTRGQRHSDGRPRIMYVLHSVHFGGAEIQLHRRLQLVKKYGVAPVVIIPGVLKDSEPGMSLRRSLEQAGIEWDACDYVCFTEPRSPAEYFSDYERNQIRTLLEKYKPAVVHTVTFIPSFGQVCQEKNIPHVSTLYAVDDQFAWIAGAPGFVHCSVVQSDCLRYATRWSQLLGGVAKICARDNAPAELFRIGQHTHLESQDETLNQAPRWPLHLVVLGTFQERKQQLETIEAVGRLKQSGIHCKLTFYGYTHFFPEYTSRCKQAIDDWNLQDDVEIRDFTQEISATLATTDILLSLSTYESFPGSIKDAFAAGIMVVATPIGGIRELVIDNITGILCRGTSVEDLEEGIHRALSLDLSDRKRIAEQGRRIARLELHPYRTANDLFRMYNLALYVNATQAYPILPGTELVSSQPSLPVEKPSGSVFSPTMPPTSTMRVGQGLIYLFVPKGDNWAGLDILLGTHMRRASGQLQLTISSLKGNILRKTSINLNTARDNDWLEIRFAPLRNTRNRPLLLEFLVQNPGQDTIISLYQSSPPEKRLTRAMKRALQHAGISLHGGSLYCREWYL